MATECTAWSRVLSCSTRCSLHGGGTPTLCAGARPPVLAARQQATGARRRAPGPGSSRSAAGHERPAQGCTARPQLQRASPPPGAPEARRRLARTRRRRRCGLLRVQVDGGGRELDVHHVLLLRLRHGLHPGQRRGDLPEQRLRQGRARAASHPARRCRHMGTWQAVKAWSRRGLCAAAHLRAPAGENQHANARSRQGAVGAVRKGGAPPKRARVCPHHCARNRSRGAAELAGRYAGTHPCHPMKATTALQEAVTKVPRSHFGIRRST
jgi:hypothetical protein